MIWIGSIDDTDDKDIDGKIEAKRFDSDRIVVGFFREFRGKWRKIV